MKIISKGHSFYHINQEAGQAPKKPKGDDIARATITINSNTRHINRKTKKGLLKQVNFSIDISELYLKGDKFQDGNLRKTFLAWANITSDTFILNIVHQVLKLRFTGDILTNVPFEYKWSQLEQSIIDEEVCKLIRKEGIITTYVQEGEFL